MNKLHLLGLTGIVAVAIGMFGFSPSAQAQSCGVSPWVNHNLNRQERIEQRRLERIRRMERERAYRNNRFGHYFRGY